MSPQTQTRSRTPRRKRAASDAIVAEAIEKSFGDVRALAGIDLVVPEGSVHGLLGPNGAGKTTFVRILTTLLAPSAGRALVLGHDVVREGDVVRASIGLTGQFTAVDENLTGAEFLWMVGRLYHMSSPDAHARAAELLDEFGLGDAGHRVVKTYSGGMQRRLDLAASLMNHPRVLFLDEPTTGLDPVGRRDMWATIRGLVSGGMTLLLTTQYLEEADHLADRISVIDHGKVIAEGTSDQLKRRIGGEFIDLELARRKDVAAALRALAPITAGEPQVEGLNVTVPVATGAGVVVEAVRRLDKGGVKVTDLIVRRPTLDDVFMILTGRKAEENGQQGASP
jgi:ABC-2 type transport system ATP-binding protein